MSRRRLDRVLPNLAQLLQRAEHVLLDGQQIAGGDGEAIHGGALALTSFVHGPVDGLEGVGLQGWALCSVHDAHGRVSRPAASAGFAVEDSYESGRAQ